MRTCAFAEVTCVFSTLPPLQTGFLAFSMIWGEGCRHGFFFENPATRWRTLLPRRFPSQTVWVIPSHAPWMLGWNLGFLEDFFGAVHRPPCVFRFVAENPRVGHHGNQGHLSEDCGVQTSAQVHRNSRLKLLFFTYQCLEQDYTWMTYIYICIYTPQTSTVASFFFHLIVSISRVLIE